MHVQPNTFVFFVFKFFQKQKRIKFDLKLRQKMIGIQITNKTKVFFASFAASCPTDAFFAARGCERKGLSKSSVGRSRTCPYMELTWCFVEG